MSNDQAWHVGERAMQARAGLREKMERIGASAIRTYMPDQHRQFFGQLPWLVVAGLDDAAYPWATVLVGAPGFVSSPAPDQLIIKARWSPNDPLYAGLRADRPIGILGIEPHTRRRNRMNGRVMSRTETRLEIGVRQSFGNCPQYINPRRVSWSTDATAAPVTTTRHRTLSVAATQSIGISDTLFVASAHPNALADSCSAWGVDVSHRGGTPGFVQVVDDQTLLIPDYRGNYFFNTLGNLLLNPAIGLLFLDFNSGERWHISAQAEVLDQVTPPFPDDQAVRWIRCKIVEVWAVSGTSGIAGSTPIGCVDRKSTK